MFLSDLVPSCRRDREGPRQEARNTSLSPASRPCWSHCGKTEKPPKGRRGRATVHAHSATLVGRLLHLPWRSRPLARAGRTSISHEGQDRYRAAKPYCTAGAAQQRVGHGGAGAKREGEPGRSLYRRAYHYTPVSSHRSYERTYSELDMMHV